MILDIDKMESAAKAVEQWSNCNQAWLDTSEDTAAAVVGHIDEDGNKYPVATVDCDQYYSGDSLPLAKFYALAHPQAVLELIARLESAEKDAARYLFLISQDSGDLLHHKLSNYYETKESFDAVIDEVMEESEK